MQRNGFVPSPVSQGLDSLLRKYAAPEAQATSLPQNTLRNEGLFTIQPTLFDLKQ
jgi:hypothetical protein